MSSQNNRAETTAAAVLDNPARTAADLHLGLRGRTITWVSLLGLLLLFLGIESTLPLSSAVKIGADEDFELSKATLCLKGYHLYTEVWNDHPPLSTFIITQILHYSFHSGIPMPPDLAVIPLKRMWTGEMTNARLAAELEEIKPGLIVLANNGEAVPYQALIEREYKLVYRDERNRLFAHRSISKKPYLQSGT